MELTGKVLVCITIQKNSKRLIEKGAKLAIEQHSKLHILHVEKGMSIFQNPEAATLLEELFEYGKKLGGEVHFISDEQIAQRIVTFIRDMEVTTVVLGETMRGKLYKLLKRDIPSYILSEAKDLEVLMVEPIKAQKGAKGINTGEIAYVKD